MTAHNSNEPNNAAGDAPWDAALDELVAKSLQVEVDPERVERLTNFWHEQSQRQKILHRRTTWGAGLVAASLLLAGGLVWFAQPGEQPQVVERPKAVTPKHEPERQGEKVPQQQPLAGGEVSTPPATNDLSPAEPRRVVVDARSAGREPTALERAMFAARTGRKTQSKPSQERAEPIVAAVEPIEPATVVLSRRSPAAEVAQFVALLRQEPDEAKRQFHLQQLLAVENETALVAYLSLLRDETINEQALVVAVESKEFPVERLLALLDHEQKQVQWTAASLLATANRCEMTEPLIARINEQPSDSTAAWFTLFTCRCERADEFLAYASQRPQLLGQFNNARLKWQRMGQGSL